MQRIWPGTCIRGAILAPRAAVLAGLVVVALVGSGCGKSGSSKPKAGEVGSGGCISVTDLGKLCGEDAVDWCKANRGKQPDRLGDCNEILGTSATDPQNRSAAPPVENPDAPPPGGYPPSQGYAQSPRAEPPPQQQPREQQPRQERPPNEPRHQPGSGGYRCEEADAPDRLAPGCQGELVPIG
jgi:hypothetical protein